MKIGLITIGAELLNGARTDTNAAWIGREVIGAGGAIDWHMTVNDEKSAIQSALDVVPNSIDVVLCTGGLGPTHDDITVDAIAAALGVGVEIHPEARAILERYYVTRGGLTDARLRMARVPAGADLIENRMSGAPGIRHGNIFIMAGVLHITAGMLESLTGTLEGGLPVLSATIGCWVAESEIADLLGGTERAHDGVQIGSYPFFREGRTGANFVIRSTDQVVLDACVTDLSAALMEGGWPPVSGGI